MTASTARLLRRRFAVGLLRLLDDLFQPVTLFVLPLRLHRLHRRLDVSEPSVCHFMLLTQIFLMTRTVYIGTILGMYTGFYTINQYTNMPYLGTLFVSGFGCGMLGGHMGLKFPKTTKTLAVIVPAYALLSFTSFPFR